MLKKSLSKTTTATAALLTLLAAPGAALACSDSPYIGTICTVAFDFCPTGFVQANGQMLPLNQNQALFSLLGTRYGGDGKTTFGVPDLRGRVVVGVNPTQQNNLSPFQLAQTRGAESVVLNTSQMASHVHPATFTGSSGSATASGNVSLPVTGNTTAAAVTGTVTANVLTGQNSGTGAIATPNNTNNTIGKAGSTSPYYPYAAGSAVDSPTTVSLTAPSTPVAGTASGPVSLAVTGSTTGGTVTVSPNPAASAAVGLLNPSIALTTCIATMGVYPSRP
jgi:microcystin-dependent protein